MSKLARSVERYLLGECEKEFRVWPTIGDCATCPTGERYVSFASDLKVEGEPPTCDESISAARNRFLLAFKSYAADAKGILFWRQKPTVEYEEPEFYESKTFMYTCPGGFHIYARLVISEVKESK